MGEKHFGARWWRESLGVGRWASRPAVNTLGLLGALSLGGCANFFGGAPPNTSLDETQIVGERDNVEVNVNALQLQRDEGWDVGTDGAQLAFDGSSDKDVSGGDGWRAAMADLATTMAPASPSLQPLYVPTLFQSLTGPAGQRLRAVMRPIHTADMDNDFARGIALRAQFAGAQFPKDTAVVVDAPGPRALAVAAALADRFAPVYTFGNWPHPLGVVPAHQTLAAALWYLPILQAAERVRPVDAPPMFVLDANRLNPYRDADREFDNRYFVRLPTAAELGALGIKHVLYVSADGTHELDDLNAAMVALCQQGVDVKMLALGDFVPADDPMLAEADDEDDGDGDAYVEPGWIAAVGWTVPWYLWPHYYYRGCWWDGGLFWHDYGWHNWTPAPVRAGRGAVVVAPPGVHRPAPIAPPSIAPRSITIASRAAWVPSPRPTMFARAASAMPGAPNAMAGASFGQVAVRARSSDGHIVAVQPGHAAFARSSAYHSAGFVGGFHSSGGGFAHFGGGGFARSGSIGRAGFGGFGGG